jgi:adenosylcobinamide kinase/adenosylcobinamide-phosphate guanylyltransferase
MPKVTYVTGGTRSGKSKFAMEKALAYHKRTFIGTAEPYDKEMKERIRKHQNDRNNRFETIEESLDLAQAIRKVSDDTEVIIMDCLTIWLGNLMHHNGATEGTYAEEDAFVAALEDAPCDVILVSNEIGFGTVPDDPLGRIFRDHAGRLNQQIAALADEAYVTISGIPVKIK